MCVIKAYDVHCEILPFLACVGLAAQRASRRYGMAAPIQ